MTAQTIPTLPGDVSDTSRTPAINAVRFAAIPAKRKPRPCWLRAGAAAFAAMALLWAGPASAAHISTTAELRAAILSSPGNVVVLDHSTKISDGARPPGTEAVSTGGTIVLLPGVSLEFEGVSMTFAGPLVVQGDSGQKAEIKISRSELNARSIRFDLPGTGSSLASALSSMRASVGDLVIAYGNEGNLEFKERLLPGPSYGLSAAGAVEITGRAKFSVVLDETLFDAGSGFLFFADRSDVSLKAEKVVFQATAGSVVLTTINSTIGMKVAFEILESTFRVRDRVVLLIEGGESKLNLKQTTFGPVNGVGEAVGVTIETSGPRSTLEASEISIFDVGTVAVRTSHVGTLKLEKALLASGGDLLIETGISSIMSVKDSSLFSETRVRIAMGSFGQRSIENTTIVAPIQELVP